MGFGRELKDFSEGLKSGVEMSTRLADARKKRPATAGDIAGQPNPFGTGSGVIPTTSGDGDKTGSIPKPGVAWKDADPYQKALLETIAGPESGGDYNVIYGGGKFTDYKDHPRQDVVITSGPNKGKTSSAAGKYQFLGSTWDRIAKEYHLTDFSPENQDRAAWYLATEEYGAKTGRDLYSDLKSGDPKILAGVGPALKGQWTSLPGGIEQGTNTDKFVNTFNSFLKQAPTETASGTDSGTTGAIPADKSGSDTTTTNQVSFLPKEDAAKMDPKIVRVTERAARDNPGLFGLNPLTKTLRTPEEQAEYVKKGWSKTQKSKHLEGKAVDLVPVNPATGKPDPTYKEGYSKVHAAMTKAAQDEGVPDLKWGGDWKNFPDMPHYQVSMLETPEQQQQIQAGGQSPPPENEVEPAMFARQGGVIPEPPQRFQGGGQPVVTPAPSNDPYSPTRAYTQPIAATPSTGFVPRRVGQALPGGAVAPSGPLTNAAGRTPSQEAFYQMQLKSAQQPAKAAAPVAAPAQPRPIMPQRPMSSAYQGSAGFYHGNATDYNDQLNAQGYNRAMKDYQNQLAAWKTANPGAQFAEGGKVGGRSLFNKFLDEERQRGGGTVAGGLPGESPRDRAALRYNLATSGKHSYAYKDDDGFFQKPKSGGGGGKAAPEGGGKPGGPTTSSTKKQWPGRERVEAPEPEKQWPGRERVEAGGPDSSGNPWDDMNHPREAVPYQQRKPEPAGQPPPRRMGHVIVQDEPGKQPETRTVINPKTGKPEVITSPFQPQPYKVLPTGTDVGGGIHGRGASQSMRGDQKPAPVQPTRQPIVPTTDPQAVLGSPTAAQSVSRNFRPGQIVTGARQGGFYDANGNPLALDQQGNAVAPAGQEPIYAPDGGIIGWQVPGPKPTPDNSDLGPPLDPNGNPIQFRSGGVIPEFESGGKIEGYENQPDSGTASRSASVPLSSDDTQPPVPPAEADNRRPERRQYDNVAATPKLLQAVGDAISGGVNFLTSKFGLSSDGAIDTPESQQARDAGVQRFASGEGAATRDEIESIDNRVDPNRNLDEGHRQMVRLAKTMQFYRDQGRDDDAKAAAASLLQYGSQRFGQLGSLAGAAYRQYEQSGNPQDLQHAVRFLEQAYDMIPDGAQMQVELNQKTGKLEAYHKDAEGHEEKFEISPRELPQYIRQTMDNSMYWNSILSTADPGMARQKDEQRFQAGKTEEERGYTRGEEERKHGRDVQEELDKEGRTRQAELEKEGRVNTEEERRALRDEALKRADEQYKLDHPNQAKPKIDMAKAGPALDAATQARQAYEADKTPENQDAYNEALSRLLDATGGDEQYLSNFGFPIQESNFVYKVAKEAVKPTPEQLAKEGITQQPDGTYTKKMPDGTLRTVTPRLVAAP